MKNIILLVFVTFLSISTYAQKKATADKLFANFAYLEAAELYKEALSKKDSSAYILTRIGDCYYKNSDSDQASYWYGKAVNKYKDIDSKFVFKYIQSLRSIGNSEAADKWLVRLKNLKPEDSLITNMRFLNVGNVTDSIPSLKVVNLNSNTQFTDFGGFESNGDFYYSSSITNDILLDRLNKRLYKWNEEPFLRIYQSEIYRDSDSISVKDIRPIVSDSISSMTNHEGALALTKDGQTLYFTGNNVKNNDRTAYGKGGTSNLKIYRAKLINGKWSRIEDLSINNKNFSTGHPALSVDEETLYFASDRDGGYGKTDLYSVKINPDGSFGQVSNLGHRINTAGREMFPFVAQDSTLYFSSDGYINNNLGLLDIYKSDILKKGISDEVRIKNIGKPFNSGYDDFSYYSLTNEESGYFSSNRPGGKGKDDIYAFTSEECKQRVMGKTYDKLTKVILPEVTVKLMDEASKVVDSTISDKDGMYIFKDLECEKSYTISGSKIHHNPDIKTIITTNIPDADVRVDLHLIPFEIKINPIFFDYDKSFIRPDAASELNRVVKVLKDYPKMIIKIESHTDSRGKDAYNKGLSDRRAKSTRDYIFSQGIESYRIVSAIGYGESRLVNRCTNELRKVCSEAEHQENRRSRFIIVNRDEFNVRD